MKILLLYIDVSFNTLVRITKAVKCQRFCFIDKKCSKCITYNRQRWKSRSGNVKMDLKIEHTVAICLRWRQQSCPYGSFSGNKRDYLQMDVGSKNATKCTSHVVRKCDVLEPKLERIKCWISFSKCDAWSCNVTLLTQTFLSLLRRIQRMDTVDSNAGLWLVIIISCLLSLRTWPFRNIQTWSSHFLLALCVWVSLL